MSDREIIVSSLRKAERRIRTNRLLGDLTFGLSVFLVFPFLFKIWDLFSPFRGRTVVTALTIWFVALIAYFVWRAREKGSLEQAASETDSRAGLYDELRSAYWFIRNPKVSDWVDVQIRRAAQKASNLNIDHLFPRVLPRASYVATSLIVVVILLNFLPLSMNHNWLLMQAAPAFTLTDAERNLLQQIEQMLNQANQEKEAGLAAKIQEILSQLEEGKIDAAQALQLLEDIQSQLTDDALDTEGINSALSKVAEAFETSEALKAAAEALRDKDLKDAAQELQNLADNLQEMTPEELKEMQKALEDASKESQEIKELSETLKKAAQGMQSKDKVAAKDSLEKAGELLNDLEKKIQDQKMSQSASQQLQDLKEMIQQRQQEQAGSEQKPGDEQSTESGGEPGEPQEASSEQSAGQQGTQSPNMKPGDLPGMGQQTSANPNNDPIKEGEEVTTLDVKLDQQQLSGEFEPEKKPTEIEEMSKEERSKLDYRNVPSELTPSQRDLLKPEHIPLEYRNLIKDYFEAIKPPTEKK
jgi:hypothetical protein